MGETIRSHFLILFLKNLKLLVRSPITLALEFVIPVFVLFIFFAISWSFPTVNHCFSTYRPLDNTLVLIPPGDRLAVAPATQRVRDIMNAVISQNQSHLTTANIEYFETAELVNEILTTTPTTYAGAVIFENLRLGDSALPQDLSYTIRYPVQTDVRTLDWNGKSPGPNGWKCDTDQAGFCLGNKVQADRYFLKQWQFQMQLAIDKAIIHLKTSTPLDHIPDPEVRQFPFPHWIENWFLVGLSESLSIMIIIGLFWNVFITTKDIAKDRDTGVREIFKSIGVSNFSILGSWYCTRLIVSLVVATALTVALKLFNIVRFSNMLLIWIIMLLLATSVVNLCFLMGTFISSSTLGMFTILISYLASYVPFLVLSQNTDQYSDSTKVVCSLMSPTAASLALANVGNWESEGIGLTWDTLNQCTGPSQFSALVGMVMMVADSLVYGVLFAYLDGIFPGKHGIGLPWNYICQGSFWQQETADSSQRIDDTSAHLANTVRGILVEDVEKQYTNGRKTFTAVKKLDLHIREGEISTLLGYNGSGKTTTLKMLAAMHGPTSGTITVNGLDLSRHCSEIRKTLGYCPQYNILIEDLTVTEHLDLFASLKGLHGPSKDKEIELSIKKLMFQSHRDTAVQKLSGGMKRKLSLGLALCGHPNVLILDEPTCGMDMEAKKVTWELLLNHKQNRTIIVSTHDMDEADLISDRCFVLSEGNIIANGSPNSIKTLSGVGYQLSLSVQDQDRNTLILPALQQYSPEVRLIRKGYKELVYAVSDSDKVNLIHLLDYLEKEGPSLGITGHGLMQSDLEEALANVVTKQTRDIDTTGDEVGRCKGAFEKLCQTLKDVVFSKDSPASQMTQALFSTIYRSEDGSNVRDFKRGFFRFKTLVRKRMLDDRRNKLGIMMKFVIPFLLVLFAMIFLKINQRPEIIRYNLNAGGLSGTSDGLPVVDLARTGLFKATNKKLQEFSNLEFQDLSEEVVNSKNTDYQNTNCCDYPFLQLEENCSQYPYNATVWGICEPLEGFGYRDCFQGCFQRDVLFNYQGCSVGTRPGEGVETDIDYFQNLFLNRSQEYLFRKYHHHGLSSSREDGEVVLTAWYSAMRRHAISQSVNLMTNMFLGSYADSSNDTITTSFWPFQTLEDSLTQASKVSLPLMIFAMFTTFSATFITASFSLFLVKERVSKMKHLQLMTGISGRVYWYANIVWDQLVFASFAVTLLVILAMFSISEFSGQNGLALFLLLMFFAFAALPITHLLSMVIDSPVLCFAAVCTVGFSTGMCGIMISIYIDNPHVHSLLALVPYSALGIGIVDLYMNQILKGFQALCEDCVTEGYVDSPFSTVSPGVGLQLLCLAIEGSVLMVLLVCIEELCVYVQLYCNRKDLRKFIIDEDGDVIKERRDIHGVAADGYPVVVNSITKSLSNNLVLNNVSFGMQKKQCVALLGPNGAGKTTLFSILSGERIPNFGSVSLFGTNMIHDLRGYRERVGYCPQVPATFPNLTGKEVLELFADLRGLSASKKEEIVTRLLRWTGLSEYGDRFTGTYSGGTLRKLSLAISLIGDPPVLLLDEPSASVDPTSRRVLWKLLRQLADSGKSILISTHIKGEVESVCDKVVVLDKGNTISVGSCTQVKQRFGAGFSLQISTADPTEVELTMAAIEQRLKNVRLEHKVGRHTQFFVPDSTLSYSDVFKAIELTKQIINLDHYSVCQLFFSQMNFSRGHSPDSFACTPPRNVIRRLGRTLRDSFTNHKSRERMTRIPSGSNSGELMEGEEEKEESMSMSMDSITAVVEEFPRIAFDRTNALTVTCNSKCAT